MLTAILITNPELRDNIVSFVSGVKKTNDNNGVIFYQKNSYIFAFSETISTRELFEITLSEYQPEKIFFVECGHSIDMDHEIGDIVLPNIFFTYNKNIENLEITAENRDSLIGEAKFLEIFDEQKDYYVEDFGLSIGGIVVENAPNNEEINDKLMMVYEADAYSNKNFSEIHSLISEEILPSIFIVGITEGKKHPTSQKKSGQIIAENIMTTIRLLADEENS